MKPEDMISVQRERRMVEQFIIESNRIEGIVREPTTAEREEFKRFLSLRVITVAELEQFVNICQPGAVLRERTGLNVRVGSATPPPGGPHIRRGLEKLLTVEVPPYVRHVAYELLHPFTDGNGRSGRALWAWQMQKFPLGFLHTYYYQSLATANADLRASALALGLDVKK
jgi:hypothetical protein